MSFEPQNTQDELDVLVGATIQSARIVSPSEQGLEPAEMDFAFSVVSLTVRYRDNLRINDAPGGVFEIWQDPEGNGPGYIAFAGEVT